MDLNYHVYALQALRFWLNDMHRQNYERITYDPDEEELMIHVSMTFYDLFEEYKKAYNPNSNMVEPELLNWTSWENSTFTQWPEHLDAYRPKDKHDVDKAEALMKLPIEKIEPCLPVLLTWLQDVNWPVGAALVKPLRALGNKLVPALKESLAFARRTRDFIWAYNLVQQLVKDLPAEGVKGVEEELAYLVNEEDDELGVMALTLLNEHKLWNEEMIQKWAKIKRDAYKEWVKELGEIIKK